MRRLSLSLTLMMSLTLTACVAGRNQKPEEASVRATAIAASDDVTAVMTVHRGSDDLLSAGLGLAGLRNPVAPAALDPNAPTAIELRRRAIHANWRGIADFSRPESIGDLAQTFPVIPGREWQALPKLPGRNAPHRVLLQLPDAFDLKQRCLVVTASSGSRGIYGAIALAGAWGLPKGCAVAYTDKGAGTGFFDADRGEGVAMDGRRSRDGVLEFAPQWPAAAAPQAHSVAMKHAHSGDNPEADWGLHVLQATDLALQMLSAAYPNEQAFTKDNTLIIAAGVSNGASAVLRAAEQDEQGAFDAVVAVSPNIFPPSRGRALFDYVTEAALYGPCAMLALTDPITMLQPALRDSIALQRCTSLHEAGLLTATDIDEQAREALRMLVRQGWNHQALGLYQQNVAFDIWRSIAATYAASYLRVDAGQSVCGYRFAMVDADAQPRAGSDAERSLWWSDANGIAPTAGVTLIDEMAEGPDRAFKSLLCLRSLWLGSHPQSSALQAGVEATRSNGRLLSRDVHILHGQDDGLIPINFSSGAYVRDARDLGSVLRFTPIAFAQHFDAFLALPSMNIYNALLPHAWRAMDQALLRAQGKTP